MPASVISKVPATLDYLVTLFTAAPSLAGVAVYDGPVLTGEDAKLILWVGLDDPDSDAGTLAASSERAWSGLEGQGELITIACAAESWSGGTDIRAERVAVYGIVAAAETLVRGDTAQFGNGLTADPGVTGADLRQNNTDRGAQARVTFSIILRAI